MLAFTSLPPPGNFGAFPLKNDAQVHVIEGCNLHQFAPDNGTKDRLRKPAMART